MTERKEKSDAQLCADAWELTGVPRPRRGVNFGNFLESEFEGKDTDGLLIQEEWFPLLREAGFDFIRLPVRWSAHTENRPPYGIDAAFETRVVRLVDAALSCGLAVIVNQHHYHELMDDPAAERDRFFSIARDIARRFRGFPDHLFLEILNEPTGRLTAGLWNDFLRESYSLMRAEDGARVLIVGPGDWNNISGLDSLSLKGLEGDRKLVVTFHYYEPHPFTHQGAPWVRPPHPTGRRWTGTEEEMGRMRRDFDAALAWGAREKRPLLVGEFGVYPKFAERSDVIAWTRAVREALETRMIPWCYWEFCHDFGVWDRKEKAFKEDLLRVLIP